MITVRDVYGKDWRQIDSEDEIRAPGFSRDLIIFGVSVDVNASLRGHDVVPSQSEFYRSGMFLNGGRLVSLSLESCSSSSLQKEDKAHHNTTVSSAC
jgi:hypothetical protein